jgi:hypothetical protein
MENIPQELEKPDNFLIALRETRTCQKKYQGLRRTAQRKTPSCSLVDSELCRLKALGSENIPVLWKQGLLTRRFCVLISVNGALAYNAGKW